MPKLISILFILSLAGSGFALEEARKAHLRKLFEVMKIEKIFEHGVTSGFDDEIANVDLSQFTDEQRQGFERGIQRCRELLLREVTWNKVADEVMSIYADIYTDEQVVGITELIDSEYGRVMTDHQAELTDKVKKLVLARTKTLLPRISDIMREEMKKQDASRPALKIGDPAPALSDVTWVKGEPAEPKGTITVVEFWATWCPPCVKSIAHLTELQKKYGDKVVIIGLSNEDLDTVKPFVEKKGDGMAYRVGIAGEKSYAAYMSAIEGIPHAYLVDASGAVVWHDHPAAIDEPLAKLVAGTYNAAEEKVRSEDKANLDKWLNDEERDIEAASALIDRLIASGEFDAMDFNNYAWSLLTDPDIGARDLELGMRLAKAAHEKDPDSGMITDTYARGLYALGMIDEALAAEEEALRQAMTGGEDTTTYDSTIKFYEQAKSLRDAMKSGAGKKPEIQVPKEQAVP